MKQIIAVLLFLSLFSLGAQIQQKVPKKKMPGKESPKKKAPKKFIPDPPNDKKPVE
ncbi:MAG: hypothetical protein AAF518_08515 [Spirochaetota bacterium]